MSIMDFAKKELKLNLSFFQRDLLMLIENNPEYLIYLKNKSQTMVQVIEIYDKWCKRALSQ